MTFEEMARLTREDIAKLPKKEIVGIGFSAMCGIYYGNMTLMGRTHTMGWAPEGMGEDLRKVIALCDELC
jgi:hypothetical protein